jgi:hypothetical protein
MIVPLALLILTYSHYNEKIAFHISQSSPPGGAVLLTDDYSANALDLESLPSVLIFNSDQRGTVNVVNCRKGQMYFFINRSSQDMGVVIQHSGGGFGSKPINQYDNAMCFCDDSEALLCR